ncbi:hypothetical protein DD571_32520, partial [Klebsiella pneumoniae]
MGAVLQGTHPKGNGGVAVIRSAKVYGAMSRTLRPGPAPVRIFNLSRLTSDQVGIPAELKHINKRRI